MKMKRGLRILTVGLIILIMLPIHVNAHRCKPVECTISDEMGPFEIEICIVFIWSDWTEGDCSYYLERYTCKGPVCDIHDNSMIITSDCTIDEQPPGSQKPRKYPTDCLADEEVSYNWCEVCRYDGEGCTSHCFHDVNNNQCPVGVDVTRNEGSRKCPSV